MKNKKKYDVLIAIFIVIVSILIPINVESAASGQLIADPGFENGYSGFYKESTNDYLYRTGSAPIAGKISLVATLKTSGPSVWWDYLAPANDFYAQRFAVSVKVRGMVVSNSSKFNICAVVFYADTGTPVTRCKPASQIVGELQALAISMAIDPARIIKKVSIKLTLKGRGLVTYMFDDVSAELIFPKIIPTPTPTPTPVSISGVWVNEGGDKVSREELRLAKAQPRVINRSWNGNYVQIFGAKNEVVSFNTIIEAAVKQASNVSVSFNSLKGPGGFLIKSSPVSGDGIFDWTNRDIELFYIRYLQVKGLSKLAYDTYDERHIPERFRRPWTGKGSGSGLWTDRPDHDKYYPDIAVPIESVPNFTIAAGENQSVWADIYIPKDAPAGVYTGNVQIFESNILSYIIPVQLSVHNFVLPDVSSAKTMLHIGYEDIMYRYLGSKNIGSGTPEEAKLKVIRDRHFAMAHRHRISLIDGNVGTKVVADQPAMEWLARLDGSLFTSAKGYRGPGEGNGNGIFAIGEYGSWNWKNEGQAGMWTHTDSWANWFAKNSPLSEFFLYLIDESPDTTQMQTWASWMDNNPSIGSTVRSMATVDGPTAVRSIPNLDIITSFNTVGDANVWQTAIDAIKAKGSQFYSYNGSRPASVSFVVDDDGVALRELAWGQYKKGVQRWFYWESTYYNNYQGGTGETDVFTKGQTFGSAASYNSVLGMTGWNTLNGDGVLFYPGTEKVFPANNYNLNGPLASLRLKHWRRGIQDVDYLTLAASINPIAVNEIVNAMIPKVLWENGVTDPNDPSWVQCDISWSNDPDVWEEARTKLVNIIETGVP